MKKHALNITHLLSICCFTALFSFNTIAETDESGGLGLSLKVSTLGLGVEGDYRFNENFNVRLQANAYAYDDTFLEDGIEYSGEIDLSSYGVLADWRPFSGTFKFTGGVYSTNNELFGSAISDGTEVFEIGNQEYRGSAGSNPLTLKTTVALGSGTAGYVGFGWGNSSASGWMFSCELGVLFSGSPEVDLTVSGLAERADGAGPSFDVNGSSAEAMAFQAEVQTEVANLEEDISEFEVYPVISLGIGYRF